MVQIVTVALSVVLASNIYGIENEYLSVQTDGKGLSLTSKIGGTKAQLVLVDEAGNEQGQLGIHQVRVSADKNFVEVLPSGEALEVRLESRFALIPEFYSSDVLFDPRLCQRDLLYVAAENFLISVAEGGKGGVMLLWPSGGAQIPMLVADGKDADRRFTKTRITFDGKSIFVSIMDHPDGLFPYVDSLEKRELDFIHSIHPERKNWKYAEVKSGWRFPFSAMWWTILTKPSPMAVSVPYTKEKPWHAVNFDEPVASVSGIPGESFRVDKPQRRWNDVRNAYRWPTARHPDGEWVLELEERFQPYHAALTYPRTRVPVFYTKYGPATPPECLVVTDVIHHTLGKETYDRVIGREGVQNRGTAPRGEPSVMATCAGSWELWIYAGRPKPERRNKEKFYGHTQALCHFLNYGVARVNEYRQMAKETIQVCQEAADNSSTLEDAAERMIRVAETMEKLWEHENEYYRGRVKENRERYADYKWGSLTITPWEFLTDEEIETISLDTPGVPEQMRDWCRDMYDKYAEKDPETMSALYGLGRMQWTCPGGRLDGMLVSCRGFAQGLRQRAALIGVNSREARELALKVRRLALESLKHYHYKETVPRAYETAEVFRNSR